MDHLDRFSRRTKCCRWENEGYRNRGYATSVVSALVEQILPESGLLLIHVESENKPAMRVYTKVGFKPYKRYFLANAER